MKNTRIHSIILGITVFLTLSFIFIGCGGDGDGGSETVTSDVIAATYDATGQWFVIDTETQDSYQLDPPFEYNADITQTGNTFSIDFEKFYGFQDGGTVNGDKYSITFDIQEEGGTTTYNYSFTLTSNDAFSGAYSWNWTGGATKHNGKGDLVGTKVE